jgi:adenine/guanine phosphoribosyltransferase-like PRPP-binding protein
MRYFLVCVCVRERERERESECVRVRCVYVYVCVCILCSGKRVLIVDDVVSTGGSIKAMRQLLAAINATEAGTNVLLICC